MTAATDPTAHLRGLVPIEPDAALPTWFRVGGRADLLARPETAAHLRACLEADPALRVLGDGANLLVADEGVGELVVSLQQGEFVRTSLDPATGRVVAGAGAPLPKLITACVRAGLGGLEALAGIPATMGGAAVMNAGGAFGELAPLVERVHTLRRDGRALTLERADIPFAYRASGLDGLIVTSLELRLTPGDPAALAERLREIMGYKKATQPMNARSAGCAFRNPTLDAPLVLDGREVAAGQRVSAGLLIDRAGAKGLRVGGAFVSDRHANFIATDEGAAAGDVIALMDTVRDRVLERFGVMLRREVVVWERAR